jgi:hypothetical protein
MSTPLVQRPLSPRELELLRLALSTFRDGSGQEREKKLGEFATRPGWRDFERAIAEVFSGSAPETKQIFDVLLPAGAKPEDGAVGLSVKSHQLSWKKFSSLDTAGRVYIEMTNAPGALFADLRLVGLSPKDFSEQKHPELFGTNVLKSVRKWHDEAISSCCELRGSNVSIHREKSGFIVVSMAMKPRTTERHYRIHGYPLELPEASHWEYTSNKKISGFDPQNPTSVLYEWYAESGGQLKYYPKGADAEYSSPAFVLEELEGKGPLAKAAIFWPHLFEQLPKE